MSEDAAQPPQRPLICVDRLRELIDAAVPLTLLDVRWSLQGPLGHEAYLAGHLPGAQFVDLDTELAAPASPDGFGGRHPLPDPDRFAAAMRAHGVRRHVLVVVYDSRDGTSAARAWWLLRHHGHEDVRVLDGGVEAWTAAGGGVVQASPPPPAGDFVAAVGRSAVLDAAGAAALVEHGVLLDARTAERFTGTREPVDAVAGHVPGAVSAPTAENVDSDGRFRPADVLRERFSGLGARDGMRVGVYCGSGVTAAHEVLALALVGIDAALYAGSWSDWITDPARPVATAG